MRRFEGKPEVQRSSVTAVDVTNSLSREVEDKLTRQIMLADPSKLEVALNLHAQGKEDEALAIFIAAVDAVEEHKIQDHRIDARGTKQGEAVAGHAAESKVEVKTEIKVAERKDAEEKPPVARFKLDTAKIMLKQAEQDLYVVMQGAIKKVEAVYFGYNPEAKYDSSEAMDRKEKMSKFLARLRGDSKQDSSEQLTELKNDIQYAINTYISAKNTTASASKKISQFFRKGKSRGPFDQKAFEDLGPAYGYATFLKEMRTQLARIEPALAKVKASDADLKKLQCVPLQEAIESQGSSPGLRRKS